MKPEVFAAGLIAAVAVAVLATDQDAPTIETRLAAALGSGLRPAQGQAPRGPAAPAQAVQTPEAEMPACAAKADILDYLARNFGERPVAEWLHSERAMITLLGRPDGATWSLLLSDAAGNTCLVNSGQGWRPIPQRAEEGAGA